MKHVNIIKKGQSMIYKKYIYLGLIVFLFVLKRNNFAQQANQKPTDTILPITVFTAKKIITMNPDMPEATAVAVSGDRILGVGSVETLQPWLDRYEHSIDDRFKDDVILPGFIEAHMHPQITGLLWEGVYLGRFDRYAPDGTFVKGNKTKKEVLERIKQVAEKKKATGASQGWLFAWGYQPEFYNNSPLTVHDLDPLTGPYDILIENASMHIYYVNSSVLKKMKLSPAEKTTGIVVKDGKLTGEFKEIKALKLLLPYLPMAGPKEVQIITRNAAKLAHRAGVTTFTEAALGFIPGGYEAYKNEVMKADFPTRVVIFPEIDFVKSQGGIAYLKRMYAQNNIKLSFGPVKFLTDGSIQGFTANLQWPYYLNGKNGIANMTLEEIKKDLLVIHQAGYQAALHTNGNQATENGIQAIRYVLSIAPRPDHRHRLEHNQMVTENQLSRMKTLGIGTNLFINHVYYWGDLYTDHILGYERSRRIDPAKSALEHGVHFSFHSDASVTPLNPLQTVWTAATRKTLQGKVLGPEQRISVYDALKAVTLGAAYLLFQDDIKGTVEVGKLADFTVINADPLSVPVDDIPKIKIKATVLGGRVFPVT